jgi:histidinol-phosphate aminotransferase
VRTVVHEMQSYEWEESTEALARRIGMSPEHILRFDMNTSPLAPPGLDEILARVRSERRVNEYFDARYTRLAEAIAAYNGVTASNVLIGAGADEVLGVVVAAFIEPGLHSAMFTPTFPMCAVYTEQRGGSVLAVPYDEAFSGPVAALIEAAQDAQLVFLCSPNNPSGTTFDLDDLERIVANVPCAVVVDEAYYEYHGVTALGLIARYPHLIILRTFSKAFGMAGVRVGYALADPRMIDLLNRLRPPNSVAYMSVLLAEAVLGHLPVVRQGVNSVLSERETLRVALEEVGLLVWPSRGNFLLARFPHNETAAFVHRHLVDRGMVPRSYLGHPRLGDCLRFTVRTPTQNARMLAELREAMAACSSPSALTT